MPRPPKGTPRNKKPDLHTMVGRYYLAKQSTKTKKEAKLIAGYAPTVNTNIIENTKTYQAIEKAFYKDEILNQISLRRIAEEQIKVIEQDENLNAKNTAIANVIERIEPASQKEETGGETVMIVLR